MRRVVGVRVSGKRREVGPEAERSGEMRVAVEAGLRCLLVRREIWVIVVERMAADGEVVVAKWTRVVRSSGMSVCGVACFWRDASRCVETSIVLGSCVVNGGT